LTARGENVRVIVIIDNGLQVLREGEVMAVSGELKNIPDTEESWQRVRANLNEAPESLRLKILWAKTDTEALRRCLDAFGWKLASLEIEALDSAKRRLSLTSDDDFIMRFDDAFEIPDLAENFEDENRLINNRFRKLQEVLRRKEASGGR